MKKLETLQLQEVSLEEIISYSKINGSPRITILDELTAPQFNYVSAFADLLEKSFTEGKQTLFEKYWKLGNEMDLEEHEYLFYFGYIIARTLNNEAKLIKETDK